MIKTKIESLNDTKKEEILNKIQKSIQKIKIDKIYSSSDGIARYDRYVFGLLVFLIVGTVVLYAYPSIIGLILGNSLNGVIYPPIFYCFVIIDAAIIVLFGLRFNPICRMFWQCKLKKYETLKSIDTDLSRIENGIT